MKRSTTFIKLSGPVRALLIGLFWLLIWQLVYMMMEKDYIVPSPFHTAGALAAMLGTGEFYVNTAVTLGRVLSGMALSLLAGAVSAVLAYFIPFVRMLLGGVSAAFKAMPVMSVILFAILCMVSGLVPVFACFLMCYPVVHTNLLEGLDDIAEEYLELCRAYHIGIGKRLRQVYLPAISANIKAALSLISGLSWKAVVAAEVLASPVHSMGYQLLTAKIYLEADRLFAWTIAIIILSILFEKGVQEVIRWL